MNDRRKGLLIAAAGVLALSPDAMLTRLAGAEIWEVLFWRGLFSGVAMLLLAAFLQRGLPKFTRAVWLLAVIAGVGNSAFVFSLLTTSVANTLVVISTSPLLAALLSAVFLKERVSKLTWGSALVVTLSVGTVAWSSFSSGNLLGDVFAMISAVGMASTFVIMRANPAVSMIPAMGLGGLLSSMVAMAFATPMAVSAGTLGWLALLGLIVLPVAFGLLSLAPQYAPAPEVSLVLLLETILGPTWVYLVVGEEPSGVVVAAGVAILITLGIWTFFSSVVRRPVASEQVAL